MNDIFRFIISIVLVALACSGAAAFASTLVIFKMITSFDKKVEQEVNRRLRHTKFVPKFNVRMNVVDESRGDYEEA